jgi:hypothetical protein
MEHTKSSIQSLLATNDRAVERAIVVIFERQTRDEQCSQYTTHLNTIGFSAAHASKGSYYAKWILSGRRLNGLHLENARKISMHYWRQLIEIAAEKEARKAA